MKKQLLLLVMMLLPMGAMADGPLTKNAEVHDYVNLGLPSGTLWATCNIGANTPEEVGDFFAWGETSPKTSFSKSNYVFYKSVTTEPDADGFTTTYSGYTKYVMESNASECGLQGFFDNLSVLEKEDDAAYILWGEHWRIPTWDEIEELRIQCNWTWVALNGVDGYKVTGPNGKFIFFPAAGFIESYTLSVGQGSMYWGSSLSSKYPQWVASLYFYQVVSDGWHAGGFEGERYYGHSIRPVYNNDGQIFKLIYIIDGKEYKNFEVEYGASITPEAEPTKEGYTFSGWSEIPKTMPAHDVIVTGTFSINKYKLTYTVDSEEYKTYEVEYGATITPEAEPTKEGYTFSGWSEIPETMPAHDVTVTGTFNINKYKLTYTVDGAEYKTYEVEYSTTITPEAAPTKEGYTFSGWSEIPETMPAHNVTVTGTFSINKYKLTYYVDGEVYKTVSYDYGATITPEAEPTKEGYTFSGWSEIPETMPAHDVTVTGTFTINKYKLTYIVDGAEFKTYEIEYNATITAEAEPTKEGYTFSGWSEIPSAMPPYDVTVTGTFNINSYKLTYMIDDKVYKEMMYEYGATITAEPQPEGDYDTFEWIDLPQTMPAHDVVVYASYTSGIIEVLMASQQNVRIYSPNGKKLNKLQKGLNIVILNDGTVKKIIIK